VKKGIVAVENSIRVMVYHMIKHPDLSANWVMITLINVAGSNHESPGKTIGAGGVPDIPLACRCFFGRIVIFRTTPSVHSLKNLAKSRIV
jgi:hypothetical protein